MDEFDGKFKFDSIRSKRIRDVFLAIGSILLIVYLALSNYVKPLDKIYSPEGYYTGQNTFEKGENPLDVYRKLNGRGGITSKHGDCVTKLSLVSKNDLHTWKSDSMALPCMSEVVTGFDFDNALEWSKSYNGEASGVDANEDHWYLWKDTTETSNMKIVAPFKSFKYTTSNFEGTDIGVRQPNNDSYLLVKNAKNWYCHIDAVETVKEHTTKIGTNAIDDNLKGYDPVGEVFAVVGIATKDTYIVGIDMSSGLPVECSPAEILGLN